jgi:hypothetical protein
MIKQQQRSEPAWNPQGALHQAGDDGRTRGDHPGYVMRRSFYTRSVLNPALTGALVAAAGVAAAAIMTRRSHAHCTYDF